MQLRKFILGIPFLICFGLIVSSCTSSGVSTVEPSKITVVPSRTATPSATKTPTPLPTSTPEPIDVVFEFFTEDGIRSSPDPNRGFIATIKPGDIITVISYSPEPYKSYWVRLADGTEGWLLWKTGMFEPLEEGQVNVNSVSTARPISRPSSGSTNSAPCTCATDTYNCTDFSTQQKAQACFNYCAIDVHKLDSDGDGRVCESLP